MIVGTAGHIDHGKTTLTRALTGVDTDRLKEEKARGISIELGYAYSPLPDGSVLGMIDVPGHEKLVHTMVAGASGIDFALLVVAADDGVMPQTREHLTILNLLGIRRGAIALTKVDRVDAARCAEVEHEIVTLLTGTPLAGMPIFRTCAQNESDPGVGALRTYLERAAAQTAQRALDRLFRLAVDRVFTLAGQGTIVTGTAVSGQVRVGDALRLAPSALALRVRSIHAQNRPAQSGHAGERLALNLPGVAREQIARGDWIVAPELDRYSLRIDVEVELLADAPSVLKAWTPVHVHLGAARRTAHLSLLDGGALAPGQRAWAQLVFEQAQHTLPGDRFILRDAQAARTIGGGRVLDPFAPARRRNSPSRRQWLGSVVGYLDQQDLAVLLSGKALGLRRSELMCYTGRVVDADLAGAHVKEVATSGGDALLISQNSWEALAVRIEAALREFHAAQPDEIGPQSARLRRIVEPDCDPSLWSALLDALGAATPARVVRQGPWLRLPGHSVELRDEEQELADKLLPALARAGFDPPWVRDLAREHDVDEEWLRALLRKLAARAQVFQVVKDRFYHPDRIAELAKIVARLSEERASSADAVDAVAVAASGAAGAMARGVSAAAFRDATGLGRKRAIQVLEFFDRVGYTRRLGDDHVLRPDSAWQAVAGPVAAPSA